MKTHLLFFLAILSVSISQSCQTAQKVQAAENPNVDYRGFLELTKEVEPIRQKRLVPSAQFLEMMTDSETILLDTRSQAAYDRLHIAGAVHLNFSDFTEEKLAKLIPNKNTRILIYCNNNFANEPRNFAAKRVELALNVPTFINLYGYGYRNLYELGSLEDINTTPFPLAGLEASLVSQ